MSPPSADADADASPLPPRLRVVVLGNSTAMYVRPARRERSQGTYGELLERRLRERGVDAVVANEARWWELIHQVLPRWEAAVAAHSPDVVVLNYGLGECQPNVYPVPLMRTVYTWRPSFNPVARTLRRALIRPLRRLMAWSMPPISRWLGLRTWRLRPSRFADELERLARLTRSETGALVLVLTLNPPGPFLRNLMPGIDERSRRYSEVIREVVARLDDPGVQVVEAGAVVDDLGWRTTVVDGLHYTARGHEEVATLLEEAVVKWREAEEG